MAVKHPYLPRDLILPNYIPNELTVIEILSYFFGFLAVTLGLFWFYIKSFDHVKPYLTLRVKLMWFFACAMIHGILEGYFSVFHKTLAGEQTFLAQIWKEYGQGDSRYVSGDTFTVCMESITAFIDGPLAAIAVYAFLKKKSYRYIVQLVLSLCQLYGDVLYFSTEIMEGFTHGPKFHPLYFWFYFFFMNMIWIIVPLLCIWESWRELNNCQSMTDKNTYSKKGKKM